jgi:hypothetical protein
MLLSGSFVSPFAMQTLLKDIAFPDKQANEAGLQLADFVPNPFARKGLGDVALHMIHFMEILGFRRLHATLKLLPMWEEFFHICLYTAPRSFFS